MWLLSFFQAIYHSKSKMHLYIENVKKDIYRFGAQNAQLSTSTTGHIVLGRYYAHGSGNYNGQLTCDSMTIWDRVLSTEERMLVHED